MPRGKLHNLQMKGTFIKHWWKEDGKKEGFSLFFQSKICSFSPQSRGVEKHRWRSVDGKCASHLQHYTMHSLTLHQWCSATSTPFHKCSINHSTASGIVLISQGRSQERYSRLLKETRILHQHISVEGGDYWHTIFIA